MGSILLSIVIMFLLLGAFATWCALVVGARCENEYRENNSN